MFNKLFDLLEKDSGLAHMGEIITSLDGVLSLIGPAYLKDGDMRDAAIDALIEILQEHKTKK
jgi:hypothetical protein